MDPLNTMTAADWRRVYEGSQEHATKLLSDLVAARRREAELVDRLRRREARVRELEDENQKLRDDLDTATRFEIGAAEVYPARFGGWALCVDRTQLEKTDTRDAALARARDIAKEDCVDHRYGFTPDPRPGSCGEYVDGMIIGEHTCDLDPAHTGDHQSADGTPWEGNPG